MWHFSITIIKKLLTVAAVIMEELLNVLGFSRKEAVVYLALLELGTQASSVIARKTGLSKSTALFLLEELHSKQFVQKTLRGRVQYYSTTVAMLRKRIDTEQKKQHDALTQVVPLLSEIQSPFSSLPKVTFFQGIEACKRAYMDLLESKTEILEFGVHEDLVARFGEKFMQNFIEERRTRSLFLRAIGQDTPLEKILQEKDVLECRQIRTFPSQSGSLYSSIAMYDGKVLLLNLHHDAFGVLIENYEFSQTMKTIFELQWSMLTSS